MSLCIDEVNLKSPKQLRFASEKRTRWIISFHQMLANNARILRVP